MTMLSLASIANRIEALEEETYNVDGDRQDTWHAMCAWIFFAKEHGDKAKEILYSLPRDHPMQDVRGKLMWFTSRFTDVLPHRPNDGWWSERVELAFAVVMDEAIEIGYSQERLETPESMAEVLAIVSDLLSKEENWTWFYEQKRQESEHHELKLKYRSEANRSQLTPDGIEWLRLNDVAYLENLAMKHDKSIDDLLYQISAKAVEKESPEQRHTRISQRIEAMNAVPEAKAPPANGNSIVLVEYQGGMHGFSLNGQPIEYGTILEVTVEQFELMQSGYPAGWWIRV